MSSRGLSRAYPRLGRLKRSRRKLVALSLVLSGTVHAEGERSRLRQWWEERTQAPRAFLSKASQDSGHAAPDKAAVLWRERPRGEPSGLPAFVPPTSLAPLIRQVRSAVVNISTVSVDKAAGTPGAAPLEGDEAARSVGSGFIISPDGHVVTNNHVVDRARQITVRLSDGRELAAEVVGKDPSTDLALLRLKDKKLTDLPFVYLGDSDALEVGDWVVAIGNPFGLDHSVSHGMISAKERVIGVGVFDDFIQTDALINPGNSGGPLFNMRGEVVGVNTAVVSRGQGIGFAVPVNMVKDLLPNLQVNGRLARGWLGVVIREQPIGNTPGSRGAVVQEVYRGSPAAMAGLRPGDRVLSVNDRPIESYLQLLRRVAILAPGSEAVLSVLRGSGTREQKLRVKLSERPAPEVLKVLSSTDVSVPLGLLVQDITAEVARTTGFAAGTGAYVAGILPGSPAEEAGLKAGDLITEVNRRRVSDQQSYQAVIEVAPAGKDVLVRYQRGEVVRYVAVRR